ERPPPQGECEEPRDLQQAHEPGRRATEELAQHLVDHEGHDHRDDVHREEAEDAIQDEAIPPLEAGSESPGQGIVARNARVAEGFQIGHGAEHTTHLSSGVCTPVTSISPSRWPGPSTTRSLPISAPPTPRAYVRATPRSR